MKALATLLAAGSALNGATAHYFFPNLIVDGVTTEYFEYVREDTQGYMPYKNGYQSTDFRCNVGSEDFALQTKTCTVKAGATVGFATDFGAQIQHPGPLQANGSKIYEIGPSAFTSDGIEWGVTGLDQITFGIPDATPAGQYLLRIEHIGLHGASVYGGAEFYFNCAQLEILGDGTATPGPTVLFAGAYTGYEPGILFDMYSKRFVNYTMPGPAVWPAGISSNISADGAIHVPDDDSSWSFAAVTSITGFASSTSARIYPSSVPLSVTPTSSNIRSTGIPEPTESVNPEQKSSHAHLHGKHGHKSHCRAR
ncbi:lytic polysaccharide monooxygenase auxiliary activity family 9 protein [Aspergillus mulundensis]|uniref:AA9 family lytic polysaccharide monooxygenase n=1 Tax=Aspergillus mulundensis TaxID=1810919 RepID=A0A3D8SL41_9EURO|nr:hypothetical protein DSM5745_03638 [Aspergillus mulundensis]RDW86996.1 hypothetical protein DSM5745_03638 [Aspergillus mulundensis]